MQPHQKATLSCTRVPITTDTTLHRNQPFSVTLYNLKRKTKENGEVKLSYETTLSTDANEKFTKCEMSKNTK